MQVELGGLPGLGMSRTVAPGSEEKHQAARSPSSSGCFQAFAYIGRNWQLLIFSHAGSYTFGMFRVVLQANEHAFCTPLAFVYRS